MKRHLIGLMAAMATLAFAAHAFACGCPPTHVYSDDAAVRQHAIEQFRDSGPAGLRILLQHREALLAHGDDPASEKLTRLAEAIDVVGGAKYCTTSKLFWYTDLDKAKSVAAEQNKPILSLRMLGKLTEDLSCANSRFFRTTLYANEEVSNLLREKFVLHWQSVRPVPKITIDFGDGRKLERTITGNSAHYVLLADGTVVDCLPGLFGPQAFRDKLTSLLQVCAAVPQESDLRSQYLVAFHQSEEAKISEAWQADLEKLGVPLNALVSGPSINRVAAVRTSTAANRFDKENAPPAEAAARVARPKALVELPSIAAIRGRALSLEAATTEQVWEQLAALHANDARLDESSRNLIASQSPTALAAGRLAITKSRVESPLAKMFRNLEQSVAVDTVRNEYELHRKFHRWHIDGTAPTNLDELNDKVYAELFLTPKSDPWLGLLPSDAYSALPNNGVVTAE